MLFPLPWQQTFLVRGDRQQGDLLFPVTRVPGRGRVALPAKDSLHLLPSHSYRSGLACLGLDGCWRDIYSPRA